MAEVNVIWKSYHEPDIIARGYWDQGILEDIFKRDTDWRHLSDVAELETGEGTDWQGAIFIINGRTHAEDTEAINADIAKLRWVLFIITGDEEATFPWREIKHPIMRVWVQLPRMNEHNDTSFKLPNGPRPDTLNILANIGKADRSQDWFFAGQINHDRREQCAHELRLFQERDIFPNGTLIETRNFGEEKIAHKDYLRQMTQTKIVLCPSGIETPDTFRLYEALEAGCLPVVDAFATRNQAPGFWQYLFEEDVPFPIVDYWDKLPALMPELLRDWPHNANRAAAWWQNKKRSIYLKLMADVKELSK